MKKLKMPIFNFIIMIFSFLLGIFHFISLVFVHQTSAQSRLIFGGIQCFVMALIILIPAIFLKARKIHIPRLIQVIYVLFAFSGLILGDVANFYDKFPWWDSFLHLFCGVLLGSLGFILINTINNDDKLNFKLSPIFVCCVSFCFAMTVGAMWEIIEYLMDDWFNLNSQQYMQTTSGTVIGDLDVALTGHAALGDTMKDLMLDFAGALVISVIGFFDIKKRNKKSVVAMKFEIDYSDDEISEDNPTKK